MMKRRRISKAYGPKGTNEEEEEASRTVIQHCGGSLADLPRPLLVEFLLRLPIKDVIVCKCVCKSWSAVISDPKFAKLYDAQAEVFPIIRTMASTLVSRILYLVQLKKDRSSMGRFSCQHCYGYSEPDCVCQFDIKLDSKLKLPLRNFEMLSDDKDDGNFVLNSKTGVNRFRCMKLKAKDHKFKIVNSCNGLLALSEPSDNNPVVVCNPVTGEFINLPEATKVIYKDGLKDYINCGLGFSPVTNQFKVVRMFKEKFPPEPDPIARDFKYQGRLAEVHTLGTESWKDIGYAPYSVYKLSFPTYLNGALHWFCLNYKKSDFIVSFDVEKECFQSFPSPPSSPFEDPLINHCNSADMSLGVLEGCLCICDSSDFEMIHVWVMKNYGIKESWTKVFTIDKVFGERWPYGLYQPIKHMNNGALLMFNYPKSALIYYDPRKSGFRYLKFKGIKSKFEAVACTPTLISLKDVVAGGNVEVLSISSRCAGLKVLGESRVLSLSEENRDLETD